MNRFRKPLFLLWDFPCIFLCLHFERNHDADASQCHLPGLLRENLMSHITSMRIINNLLIILLVTRHANFSSGGIFFLPLFDKTGMSFSDLTAPSEADFTTGEFCIKLPRTGIRNICIFTTYVGGNEVGRMS